MIPAACLCRYEFTPAKAGANTSVALTHFSGEAKTEKRKGFTLIELMVVIFIIGILAVVAIPIMRGRINSAKWSEGKAGAGSIRTAVRAFCGEKGESWDYSAGVSLTQLGFNITLAAEGGDLDGKHFSDEAYTIAFTSYNTYTVTVTPANSVNRTNGPSTPASVTLDQDGVWTENP